MEEIAIHLWVDGATAQKERKSRATMSQMLYDMREPTKKTWLCTKQYVQHERSAETHGNSNGPRGLAWGLLVTVSARCLFFNSNFTLELDKRDSLNQRFANSLCPSGRKKRETLFIDTDCGWREDDKLP
jgi:hypothetical protein